MTATALLHNPMTQPNPKCGAKTRRGTRCRAQAMANGRCDKHGGKSPAGPASPHWKHGRYSKAFNPAYKQAIEELLADPEILSLNDNIRIVDVEIGKAVAAVQDVESAADWQAVRELSRKIAEALKANDAGTLGLACAELLKLTHAGSGLEAARARLMNLQQHRRKLVQTEAARLAAGQAAISVDRAIGLILILVDVMFRHVVDKKVRMAIIADVQRMEVLPGQWLGAVQPVTP